MINTSWINEDLIEDMNTYTDHIQFNRLKLTTKEAENIFEKICNCIENNIHEMQYIINIDQEDQLYWNFIDATIGVTKNCKTRTIEQYKKIFELEYIKISR